MKVGRISATTHRIGIEPPLLGHQLYRPIVLVKLETDDGVVGYGMTSQLLRWSVREFINREVAPFLAGRDVMETERLWHEMLWTFNPRSNSGAVQAGISAVDIALWDAKGKYLRQPVWKLLGGHSARVPAYVTFGLFDYDRSQLVEAATRMAAAGHDKLKMVVAADRGKNLREDAARVKAVREAIGPNVELMVDGNQLLSPVQAAELCRMIEPYDISWYEEPLWANDPLHLADLRHQTRIPIAAGQNEGHRWRQRELIAGQAVDIAQTNVIYVGGFTEGLRVAHLAQAFDLPLANGGGWPHHNAHLIAAVANGWRVEFHYVMWKASEFMFAGASSPSEGWVTLTDAPGLGLEPRESAQRETLEP